VTCSSAGCDLLLRAQRPDIRWDAGTEAEATAVLGSAWQLHIVKDGRSEELALLHRPTRTFLNSDLLYKSDPACCAGPGGPKHRYTAPAWYAQSQQALFCEWAETHLYITYITYIIYIT
jgi:hypothetical protein